MAYLLDSSTLISLLRGEPRTTREFEARRSVGMVCTSLVACGELARGAYRARLEEVRQKRLVEVAELLEDFQEILTLSHEISDAYGHLTAYLDSLGAPIPTNDAWIAATALVHDLILVSDDAHFARVPGLKLENWAEG